MPNNDKHTTNFGNVLIKNCQNLFKSGALSQEALYREHNAKFEYENIPDVG